MPGRAVATRNLCSRHEDTPGVGDDTAVFQSDDLLSTSRELLRAKGQPRPGFPVLTAGADGWLMVGCGSDLAYLTTGARAARDLLPRS